MTDFIEYLKYFNRKERFFLIGMALGDEDLKLSQPFRKRLNELFDLQIPDQAFWAMDYHIDWLYACLHLSFDSTIAPNQIHLNQGLVTGNQEDIDFLIAYRQDQLFHLIMLEAKGTISWSNSQIKSKLARLQELFADSNAPWIERVHPHFALVSPREPHRMKYDAWPKWAMDPKKQRPHWLKLKLPPELYRPSRCEQDGTPSNTGSHWNVISIHYE